MFDTFQSAPGGCALPGLSAAGVDCAALSAEQLVDVVAAVERLVARAHGLQLTALAELGRRCAAAGAGEGHPSSEYVGALECAAAEVAPACRWTRTMAEHRVELAAQLEQRLPATLAALSEGRIDLNRARAMAEATEPLDADAAAVAEARVLARAGSQTAAQLRVCLRRAVLAVDPVGAEHRHQVAVGKRRVEVRQLPDGVAELIAPMRADHAEAIYARLSDIARQVLAAHRAGSRAGPDRNRPVHDDEPGLDSLRADALAWLTLGEPMPGLPVPAIDATPPAASTGSGAIGVAGNPTANSARPAARGCAHCGSERPKPLVRVVVPVGTVLGVTDEPAELAGYGPIPASLARELAADAQWRRILTDPATGATVATETRSYTPPASMSALVRARDGTCRFPGCRQPASRVDLDHVLPWPHGQTCPCNLCSLCRFHHLLKTHHGWRLRIDPDTADVTWTSPLGRRYTTSADGIPPLDGGSSAQLRLARLSLRRTA
ncbi:MAG: HNH endonuclease [Actinomycetota bacterium]|nr:HNH endonuclease [Actinomycetota bacterium]